jgi:uncharacterized lipoprotein YmbA
MLDAIHRSMLLLATAMLLGACSLPEAKPDPTRYYLLTTATSHPTAEAPAGKKWRLGLRPIETPVFLRNRAMLVRSSGNEVRFVDEARWAESLDASVARVLRDGLEARADVERVTPVNASSQLPRDFDVLVRIQKCEGVRDAKVARFQAVLEIYSTGDEPARVAREVFAKDVSGWDGADFSDLAKKLSSAVDELAERTIALLPSKG